MAIECNRIDTYTVATTIIRTIKEKSTENNNISKQSPKTVGKTFPTEKQEKVNYYRWKC